MPIRQSIPVLRVGRVDEAEAYYCGQLGFAKRFLYKPDPDRDDPGYLGVEWDGAWLHLSSHPGDSVPGASVHLVVEEIDALHEEFVGRSVTVALPPTDQSWNVREIHLDDPFGNWLVFGEPMDG